MINLYDFELSSIGANELIDVIYEDDKIRVERIVSMGHTTPEGFIYDQTEDELVTVIEGDAVLELTDSKEKIVMSSGDCYMIKAGVKHRVASTSSPCVWLCVFTKIS